ncbi:hypothetical protein AeMF1_019123 [Aphanomyces euteiches]|nr:hypothetical protein AeMF1_019123 [Aphanomyces euteiches]KAH9195923.1 hypothetical protein AeNC1_002112 [Aphanomyces euteiches]
MFEKWIEGLIVEYFSEWLEGFDKDGMRVALYSGKISFTNLKFKKQALDKLHVPIVLKEGRLGVLNVKVPWKRLSKESVHIVLEDLYILLSPYHDDSSESRSTVDERHRHAKQHEIRLRELMHAPDEVTSSDSKDSPKASVGSPKSPKSSGSSSFSWKQKMLNLIMDNLTFELKRIHIRYEDTSCMVSATPLSFGISIDELKISTTNANGHVTFMDRSTSHTPFVHKVFEIKEGYVYWDFAQAAQSGGTKMAYLIEPVTTAIKITENHDSASHQFIPKYRVHVNLPSLRMTISPRQCKDITNVLDFLVGHEVYLKRSRCRKARPGCSVHENPRRWWKYALQSVQVLEHNPHRSSWRKTLALVVLRDKYIPLYMRHLDNSISRLDEQQLRILEDDPRLSPDCIVFFRACAAAELDMETKRRKQYSKPSKWPSLLKGKGSNSKPSTPVSSPRGGSLFSPKQQVTQPSSPTASPKDQTPPLLVLDPVERQLVYESVSQRYFELPKSSVMASTINGEAEDKNFGMLLALELQIDDVMCAVAKEAEKEKGGRKEFVRFQIRGIQASYNQHMSVSGLPEMQVALQLQEMQLIDATQPPESPLAVIFGHTKKALTAPLVQLKFHRRPDNTLVLAVTIESCHGLYHKKAFDKITKYVTPDQPKSSSNSAPLSPSSFASKRVQSLPIQLTLIMPDFTCSIAGKTAETPFVVLHLATMNVRTSNAAEAFDMSVDNIDVLIVSYDRLAGLWEDISLQAKCRLIKKFKIEWQLALHREDPSDDDVNGKAVGWTNNIQLSTLGVTVSDTLCQHLYQLVTYLLAPPQTKKTPKPRRQILPFEIALSVPTVSLQLTGTEHLRQGVVVEWTQWVSTIKCLTDLTSVHWATASLIIKEAQANSCKNGRVYSFGTTLLDVCGSTTMFLVLGRQDDSPTLRVDLPTVRICWHYHLLRDILQLTVARLRLQPAIESTKLLLHIRLHLAALTFILNPVESPQLDATLQGGDIDGTIELYQNGNIFVDASAAAVAFTMDKWSLASLPDTTTFRYETSGVYSLPERDGAASYVEVRATQGNILLCQPHWVCVATYLSAYVSELFTWLYLTREGQGKKIMDPSKLRLKVLSHIDGIEVKIPTTANTMSDPNEGDGKSMRFQIKQIAVTSDRYLDTSYEQISVEMASIEAPPWWTNHTTSARVQYLFHLGESRQQITIQVPALDANFDVTAYTVLLETVAGNFLAPTIQMELPEPPADVETTFSIGFDDVLVNVPQLSVTLTVHGLHATWHQTTTHHSSLDVTWQTVELMDVPSAKCSVNLSGRQRLEYEVAPDGRESLGLTFDSIFLAPDMQVLYKWTTFASALPKLPILPSNDHQAQPPPPIEISIAVKAVQLLLLAASPNQYLLLQGAVQASAQKSVVQVQARGVALIIACTWPLPHFQPDDPLHFHKPSIGRALCSTFDIDADIAAGAIQLTLSSVDVVVTAGDLKLMQAAVVRLLESPFKKAPASQTESFVSVVLNQASVTLVSPPDQSASLETTFAPKIRVYGHRALFKQSFKFIQEASHTTDWSLSLTDETCCGAEEGVSVWCFNAPLGVWEPLVEPWAFHLAIAASLEDDTMIHRVSFHGAKLQPCHVNISPCILEAICSILDPLLSGVTPPQSTVAHANASCGVAILNDTTLPLSYYVSGTDCRALNKVPAHEGATLQLTTTPILVSDQTIVLQWDDWAPVNDVRLHSFGQTVALLTPSKAQTKSKQVFPLLLDVENRRGRRTLTISSVVKVYNDSSIPVRVGCIRDNMPFVDSGVVNPGESRGLPLDVCETLHGLRIVLAPGDDDKYDWSEDPVSIEATEPWIAACPLKKLPKPSCTCMAAFSTTSPQVKSTSVVCTHGKMFLRVMPKIHGSHAFASIRVVAPVSIENQSPIPMTLLLFTTKKRLAKPITSPKGPALDEEIEPVQLHLVTSTTIAPQSRIHIYSVSLLNKTYASVALASQQWSQLQPLELSKAKDNVVVLTDEQKRQHAVNWSISTNSDFQLQLTIWPSYVLVDETNLQLLYDVDLSSKKSITSILHLSKNSNNGSATDTLETDVIEATLEVLSSVVSFEAKASPQPFLLSGVRQVTIRLDPVRGMRTSTATVQLEAISDSVQNAHRLFCDAAKEWRDLGVRVTMTHTKSKIVTFVPRYMVLNLAPVPFVLCPALLVNKTAAPQQQPPGRHASSGQLPSQTTTPLAVLRQPSSSRVGQGPVGVATYAPQAPFSPFHWTSMAEPSDYAVRTKPAESSEWKWSGRFSLHEVGETALNVINKSTGDVLVVRIHIRVVRATQIFIVISLEEAINPLYRLVNETSTTITFGQHFFDLDPGYIRDVAPTQSVWFGWDEPFSCESRALRVAVANTDVIAIVVDEVHDAVQTLGELFVQIYLDGLTKVVHVSERHRSRDTLMRISSQEVAQNIRYVIDVLLPRVVLSLVHGRAELVVLTVEEISVIGGYTPEGNEIEVKVKSVQIDNQQEGQSGSAFPVLFAPSKEEVDKDKENEETTSPPFVHVSLVRLFYHPNIEFVKYLSVLMQPATLQLDASILFSIADMVSEWLAIITKFFPDAFNEKPISLVAERVQVEPRVYFETLQLHPLKLCVTFAQSTLPSQAEEVMAVVPGMFRILQTHLANIDNAPLHLNALHIFHCFTSISLLVSSIRQHYTTQSLRQIYSLIGSAEILGNPLGLVSNLGSGVKDFFYEPAAGMVRGQFVKGLTRGTESLVKNSVYGTFNAASKLTGSISTGLANLSMDKTYIQSRTNRPKKDGPTNVGAGLLLGTKQLGQGILAGVSGIITQPAMGAYHNGLTGFVEGVGKGIIGAAVKPTAGILDLAAQTTAGITYSAASFDKKPKLTRLRLPRMMATADKRLTIYVPDEASVAAWLTKLPASTLAANEQYERHVLLPNSRALIATSRQLMVLDNTSAKPRVLWAYLARNVLSSHSSDEGVVISIDNKNGDGKLVTVKIPLEAHEHHERDKVEALIAKLVTQNQTTSPPPPPSTHQRDEARHD